MFWLHNEQTQLETTVPSITCLIKLAIIILVLNGYMHVDTSEAYGAHWGHNPVLFGYVG